MLPPDPLFRLKSDMGHVHSICFVESIDDSSREFVDTLLAATESGYVYFWDLEKYRLKYKQKMGASIQAVHTYKEAIFVQEKEGVLSKWEKIDNSSECYTKSKSKICAFGFCKSILYKGKYLAVPLEDLSICIYKMDEKQIDEEPSHHLQSKLDKSTLCHLMCIEMTSIDEQIFILGGYESGRIVLWRMSDQIELAQLQTTNLCTTSIAFDNCFLKGVICNGLSNAIDIFVSGDRTLSNLSLKQEIQCTSKGFSVCRLRHDRKILVIGGCDGRLRIYSWKTLRVLVVLSDHRQSISDVQFSRKCVRTHKTSVMAAAGADGMISLWSLYN